MEMIAPVAIIAIFTSMPVTIECLVARVSLWHRARAQLASLGCHPDSPSGKSTGRLTCRQIIVVFVEKPAIGKIAADAVA